MTWKTTLIQRRVAGVPANMTAYYTHQDNDRVRFFLFHHSRVRFTRSYANIEEGMAQVASDYLATTGKVA